MMDIISGSTWGRQVKGRPSRLNAKAISELTVHYTGAPSVSIGKSQVAGYIKRIEAGHQAKDSSTIGYNLVIDKWGRVWEGRGLDLRNAANGTKSNDTSVSVLLLVGVKDNEPTPEMVNSLKQVYTFLSARYNRPLIVRPHQFHKPTACPGPRVLDLINSGDISNAPITVTVPSEPQYATVTVVKGDSWWGLARRLLGSGFKWKQLKDLNNGVALHPGVTIKYLIGGK